ncbi:uncharacterized protein LOC117322106 [Pecten maximus]|uniref:uncharacterized protein LOC117322106 n=1 Tax=Pecten maximus TaxID=6579 RepID=UPI001458D171|nr:uncharacterized protein LOC117322106 [Pecten maximus]
MLYIPAVSIYAVYSCLPFNSISASYLDNPLVKMKTTFIIALAFLLVVGSSGLACNKCMNSFRRCLPHCLAVPAQNRCFCTRICYKAALLCTTACANVAGFKQLIEALDD